MITIEEYIEGLERCAKNLPQIFLDWHSIDFDLLEEYKDQLNWNLDQMHSFKKQATEEQRNRIEFEFKMIFMHRKEILQKFGIKL